MTNPNKKPAPGGTGTGSSTAFDSPILPHWLVSLPTTAACIASLGAPIVAALSGLIEGGAR
jgi:hypothetical protein